MLEFFVGDRRRMVSTCLTVGILIGAALALVGCSKDGYFYANGSYNNGGCGPYYGGVDRCAPQGMGTPQSRAYHNANGW